MTNPLPGDSALKERLTRVDRFIADQYMTERQLLCMIDSLCNL
jgi:hypothetical protein